MKCIHPDDLLPCNRSCICNIISVSLRDNGLFLLIHRNDPVRHQRSRRKLISDDCSFPRLTRGKIFIIDDRPDRDPGSMLPLRTAYSSYPSIFGTNRKPAITSSPRNTTIDNTLQIFLVIFFCAFLTYLVTSAKIPSKPEAPLYLLPHNFRQTLPPDKP